MWNLAAEDPAATSREPAVGLALRHVASLLPEDDFESGDCGFTLGVGGVTRD